jgi:hypothetical protein
MPQVEPSSSKTITHLPALAEEGVQIEDVQAATNEYRFGHMTTALQRGAPQLQKYIAVVFDWHRKLTAEECMGHYAVYERLVDVMARVSCPFQLYYEDFHEHMIAMVKRGFLQKLEPTKELCSGFDGPYYKLHCGIRGRVGDILQDDDAAHTFLSRR